MKSIVGIFNSFADATRGAALLRTVGISEDHIAVLSPHTPEAAVELRIPTTETEQPGMGQALGGARSEEHTSELQSHHDLVCRLLLEKKKKTKINQQNSTHQHHSQ